MGVDLDFPKPIGVNAQTARALLNKDWPQYDIQELEVTFDGGTTNGIGDENGTSNPYTMFIVTGIVEISIIAKCTTTLVGAGTIEVGTTTTTAGLIAQIADATDLAAGEIWHDATPDASVELTSVVKRNIVAENVELLVGTADITAGVITFIVKWAPISSDGNVVAV